jgi:hypothetical protein
MFFIMLDVRQTRKEQCFEGLILPFLECPSLSPVCLIFINIATVVQCFNKLVPTSRISLCCDVHPGTLHQYSLYKTKTEIKFLKVNK